MQTVLHFDKMHAFCMIECFNFDQLLYSHYKRTLTGNIHPTDYDVYWSEVLTDKPG